MPSRRVTVCDIRCVRGAMPAMPPLRVHCDTTHTSHTTESAAERDEKSAPSGESALFHLHDFHWQLDLSALNDHRVSNETLVSDYCESPPVTVSSRYGRGTFQESTKVESMLAYDRDTCQCSTNDVAGTGSAILVSFAD